MTKWTHGGWAVQGRVFIDRDPKHFRIVLNYLRDGACTIPIEETEIAELLKEIDFYQVLCSPLAK